MMKRALALLIPLCLAASMPARAADKFTFIFEKQEKKEQSRWTLASWLETRDRMRLMDLWLSLHSPSPYEFYLGGAYKTGNLATVGQYTGWDVHFAAYAYFFGLEVQRQTSILEPRWLGQVHVRLLGYHNQATNLTFMGGLQSQERAGANLMNPTAGASMTVYLFKSFGINALYRHTFQSTSGVINPIDRGEIGAFIDFNFVRIFGDYLVETEASSQATSFTGGQLGMRVYF